MENVEAVDGLNDTCGLGLKNLALATLAGGVAAVAILVWGIPGLDPAMWSEAAVAARIRPPQTIFPGFWRVISVGLFSTFGVSGAIRVLTFAGAALGGVAVALVYLIVRQTLALLIRTGRPYAVWSGRIAPFFAFVAAALFGLSDPLSRIARVLSPSLLRFAVVLVIVHLALRWFVAGGRWRLFPLVALMGLLAAETPFGFLLPVLFVGAYALVWCGIVDGLFPKPEKLPAPDELPKWRMFFLFFGALALAAYLNAAEFVSLGGAEANGWGANDVYFRYAGGYWRVFAGAASVVGWVLGLVFGVLPLLVALKVFPMVTRDDRPMPFNLGVLLFLVGMLAVMQCGALPAARFWTFTRDIVLVQSGFLLAFFTFCAMVALALFGAAFAFECQRTYLGEDERRPGVLLRGLVPCLTAVVVALACRTVPKPVETEMQRIVDDAVRETVEECAGAKYLFTDGHLDAAVELCAKDRGQTLYTLNMMSGASAWECAVRSRPFAVESDDWHHAQTGVPALLRIWAGEKVGGMDEAAIQLGFEFWKRERKPLPTLSGMVAREKGLDAAAAQAGVERSKALADRILALAPKTETADPSPALASAFSAVSWRISRFARIREDATLANDLDESNTALKKMLSVIEQERQRTFLQMTPREGLQIALKRANFAEARRYAAAVLRANEDDAEANFAMGMSSLTGNRYADAERYLSRCLKVRPNEPAVLNNLSIICRKLRRYKEAEDYARRALKILPDSPEVKQTLADALKKAP